MMRSEKSIRETLKIVEFLGKPEAVQALKWTPCEYGPPEPPAHPEVSEQTETAGELLAVLKSAVEHCDGWRKLQGDDSVPFLPRILEDEFRAAIAKSEGRSNA